MMLVDAVAGVAWFGTTAWVLFAGWRFARALFPSDSDLQCLLHASLIGWAVVAGSGLLLGAAGLLAPWGQLSVALTAACVLWQASDRQTRGEVPPPPGVADGPAEWWYLVGWAAVGGAWWARVIVLGLFSFPDDWDSLNYHIPVVHCWLRAGSLYAPDCNEWWVPGTNELIGLWLTGMFSGDFLIGLASLPATTILALGTIELGRLVGLAGPVRHAAALVVLAAEVTFRQALTQKNDIAAAALFVAAMCYVVRHLRTGHTPAAVFGGVCIGLLAGVKYYALGYAGVAGLTWVVCRWVGSGWKSALRVAAGAAVLGAAGGGYWYVRNWAASGTPLYPKGLGRTDALSGWRPQGTWESTLLGNGSPEVFSLLLDAVHNYGGPVPLWALLTAPAVLLYVAAARRILERSGYARPRLELLAAGAGAGLVWATTPFAVEIEPGTLHFLRAGYLTVRFGFCCLALCVVAAAVPIGDAWRRPSGYVRAVVAAGLGAILWWQVGSLSDEHPISGPWFDIAALAAALVLGGAGARGLRRGWPQWTGAVTAGAIGLGALAFGLVCAGLSARWHREFVGAYAESHHTDLFAKWQTGGPPGKVFVAAHKLYPFSGPARQVVVCRRFTTTDPDEFLRYLLDREPALIVVEAIDISWAGHIARIRGWVEALPQIFSPVDNGVAYRVYRIDRVTLERVISGL